MVTGLHFFVPPNGFADVFYLNNAKGDGQEEKHQPVTNVMGILATPPPKLPPVRNKALLRGY